ncbi:hypothetical protein E2C01_002840 [Portunus trituberculatus]|uniref:Uncharacterized protein n=1 Tax=Portunus trituberculatus TaxID=210409 RepID=A0A5B7CKZ3_PORTR|nr:hypothetical protein [Portunus trituberculatus]
MASFGKLIQATHRPSDTPITPTHPPFRVSSLNFSFSHSFVTAGGSKLEESLSTEDGKNTCYTAAFHLLRELL